MVYGVGGFETDNYTVEGISGLCSGGGEVENDVAGKDGVKRACDVRRYFCASEHRGVNEGGEEGDV